MEKQALRVRPVRASDERTAYVLSLIASFDAGGDPEVARALDALVGQERDRVYAARLRQTDASGWRRS